MTNERTYQIVIAVLVFIIVVGGWFVLGRNGGGMFNATGSGSMATTTSSDVSMDTGASDASSVPAVSSADEAPSTMPASGESVEVYDQIAGMSVAVQSLKLDQAGWVAVRGIDGRILGAGWFPAGMQSQVSVPLLRGTTAGERYQVLLYADDGDRAFDLHKDTLLTAGGGSVAGTTFSAK